MLLCSKIGKVQYSCNIKGIYVPWNILFTEFNLDKYGVVSETVLLLCFSIFLDVFSWQVKKLQPLLERDFLVSSLFIVKKKDSLESMEVEFILTVKCTCFFKNHHFYVESVSLFFITEVQSQIPIKKDEMVLIFFRVKYG